MSDIDEEVALPEDSEQSRLQAALELSYCQSGYYYPDLGKLVHHSVVMASREPWAANSSHQLSIIQSRISSLKDQVLLELPNSDRSFEAQDQCRQRCVEEFNVLSQLVQGLQVAEIVLPPPANDADMLQAVWQRVIAKASRQLNKLQSQIFMHQRILELLARSERTNPADVLSLFIEHVLQPAFDARDTLETLLITQNAHLRFPNRYSEATRQRALEAVAEAEGNCVEASTRARREYDGVIPLLRFGYPYLRSQIWESVDKLCGFGAIRTDVSLADFAIVQPNGPGPAETDLEARERKRLTAMYFVKPFLAPPPETEREQRERRRPFFADCFFRELEVFRLVSANPVYQRYIGELMFAFEDSHPRKGYYLALKLYEVDVGRWFRENCARQNSTALLRVLGEIAEGLSSLHSCGVIHGDLKPSNIMMDGRGPTAKPKIVDFNYSELPSQAPSTYILQIAPAPLGRSEGYCPPEFESGDLAARTTSSDIFSLGRTFHSLLSCFDLQQVFPTAVIDGLQELITRMTHEAPELRLHLTQESELESVGTSVRRRLEYLGKLLDNTIALEARVPRRGNTGV